MYGFYTPNKYQKERSVEHTYSFNAKPSNLSKGTSQSVSFDEQVGASRADDKLRNPASVKIKSNGSFNENSQSFGNGHMDSVGRKREKPRGEVKFPRLRKADNPEEGQGKTVTAIRCPDSYYQARLFRSLSTKENTYLANLSRQHFIQTIDGVRLGKCCTLPSEPKQLKLSKKHPKHKTVFLDLDETLIHCGENLTSYTVRLSFPVDGGGSIMAGVKVRPNCLQFLKQLSTISEIIIFTASSASYADVILDYLDPQKKYFSHRLYRHHCTIQSGIYTKDLRIANRRMEDSVIVDNSAYSFMCQPYNGIPILPYYHYSRDKQLVFLLDYLKIILEASDVRDKIKETFFWEKYLKTNTDPRKVLLKAFQQQKNQWKN